MSFLGILLLTFLSLFKSSYTPNVFHKTNSLLKKSTLKQAPDFILKDINGKSYSIKDFRGKVVYLDIWASWCTPCLYEIKKSKKNKEYFKGNKEVVFLYISIDESKEKWNKTINGRNIEGIHLISKNGLEDNIKSKYNTSQLPKYVLINKEGQIVSENATRPSDPFLIDDIEELL